MTWARVDDGFWCHPKVLGVDLLARGLWVSTLSWSCQQQTSRVPFSVVRMCGDDGTAVKTLVDAGLWDEIDGEDAWSIHDWEQYQSESAKKAEAGRKGGKASGEARRAKAIEANQDASGEAETGASDEAGPTRPDPTRETFSSENPSDGIKSDPETVDRLCALLADAVQEHGKVGRPKIGKGWRQDMDRLLRLGPVELEAAEIAPQRIERAIGVVFTQLAIPTSGGFCWADQVQSPAALRKHWVKLQQAAQGRRNESPTNDFEGLQ